MSMEIKEYRENALEIADTPQEMAVKLADMKAKLGLVQRFFKEVMVKDQDYGVIPGTEKPTLLKPGAEKLCELYGYAPVVKNVDEEKNIETGFYRARVTIALVHRRSGVVVAEGVGEANTMEGRYRWRWLPEWKLPDGLDKNGLYSETRIDKNGKKYKMYRLENQDPWTLWNTVLKMAKKRALIDATLSATRSSGIFTQDTEDLEEWMASTPGYEASLEAEPEKKKASEAQIKAIFAIAKEVGYSNDELKTFIKQNYNIESTKELTSEQASEIISFLKSIVKAGEQQ